MMIAILDELFFLSSRKRRMGNPMALFSLTCKISIAIWPTELKYVVLYLMVCFLPPVLPPVNTKLQQVQY